MTYKEWGKRTDLVNFLGQMYADWTAERDKLAARVKELERELSVRRGLAQAGTIDRGSFRDATADGDADVPPPERRESTL